MFHTGFVSVCHYAISELCKGLYHHKNGVWHESSRPQIHRFRPQARAPPLGVCRPHQRCGDGEVSGSCVSEGVSEAPTFIWSGARWWCRPTRKVAAAPCRCASTTIRLCDSATVSVFVRDRRNMLLATAPADSDETFTVAQRTVCAVAATVKVAGGAPVRPHVRGVPPR